MGVDYRGNFGIGTQIHGSKIEDLEIESLSEFVYELLEDTKESELYQTFQTGEGNYSGEENEQFICIKDPFRDGIEGLEKKWNQLKTFLDEKKIDYNPTINAIGGLYVY